MRSRSRFAAAGLALIAAACGAASGPAPSRVAPLRADSPAPQSEAPPAPPPSEEPPLAIVNEVFAVPTEEEMAIRRASSLAPELVMFGAAALQRPSVPPFTTRERAAFQRALVLIEAHDYEGAFQWLAAIYWQRRPTPPVAQVIADRLGNAIGFPERRLRLEVGRAVAPAPRPARAVRLNDELARPLYDADWLGDHAIPWPVTGPIHPTMVVAYSRGVPLVYGDLSVWVRHEPSVGLQRGGSRVTTEVAFEHLPSQARSRWAEARGDVLLTSVGAAGSAFDGILVAVDFVHPPHLLWRSEPHVCLAQTFAWVGDDIVCGGEDGHGHPAIVVLDRNTGAIAARARVAEAPRAVLAAADRVFVRGETRDFEAVVAHLKRTTPPR